MAHRVQVGAGGREAAAAVHVAVEPGEALLAVAVDVVGEVVPRLLGGLEERAEERVGGRPLLEHERAVAAPPLVGADGAVDEQAGLHPLEVGQAVGVAPLLHARLGRPALVVHRVAALEDHPVDARRPAEHLAAGVEHPAAVHVGLGVGPVLPVVEAVADRDRQRRRHVHERVDPPVGVAGLEDQDAGAGIGGDAVGERAAGRATTHDHHVVPVCAHLPSCPRPSPRTSAGRPAAGCARRAWSRGTRRGRPRRARGPRPTACSRPTRPAGRTGGSR